MQERLTQLEQKFDALVRVVEAEREKAAFRYEALEAVFVHVAAAMMIQAGLKGEAVAGLRAQTKSIAGAVTFSELGPAKSMHVAAELEAQVDMTMARLEERVTNHWASVSDHSSPARSPQAARQNERKRKSPD